MADEYSTAELLAWEFPKAFLRKVNKGYGDLDYVPASEVVVRLNKVLGVGNWGMTVDSLEVHGDWLIARVTLSVLINDRWVSYGAAGGHKDEKGALGDAAKSAVSDAMKKAATLIGVGLYLSRKPEALRYDKEKKSRLETE